MEIIDILKQKPYKYIFLAIFSIYFIFFQYADRLLLFVHIITPVDLILSTSPPVNPSQMPFPLWGPFLSVTTPFFTWAITPISLSISFILSLLVSTNVVLYLIYYRFLKTGAKKGIVGSLGLIATSLSCSCELFTALIGSATSSLPFLFSISFMDRLSETLVLLAIFLLSFSTYVLYNEINNRKPLSINLDSYRKIFMGAILIFISIILPTSVSFSLLKIILDILAGGIIGTLLSSKSKVLFYVSITLTVLIISFYDIFYSSFLLIPVSLLTGFFGSLGLKDMKKWVKLGIMHVIAWTMIMPGPISLILGYPLPFFNFSPGELYQLWIFTWIAGTPIAWFAGIYYLQYLRDSMSEINFSRIRFSPTTEFSGIKWILIGSFAIILQILFFITHEGYFVDYNGFDYNFLVTMTITSTLVMLFGSVAVGYGIYESIKSKFTLPKINRKDYAIFSTIYGLLISVLGGIIHFNVSGFPYPHVYLFMFGMPMMDPSVLLYFPPYIGIYIDPLEFMQMIAVSLIGGYLISLIRASSNYRKNAYALSLGALGICPACFLSTYVLGLISASLGASLLFSLSNQLIISFSADVALFLTLIFTLRRNRSYCEIDFKK
ncbi:hypothetical protein [Acidianus brierleyi]|uniref:Uncharacterized protein n=1 Tax=Acidianus brierleyi TaxID=41673 RepID=A0A2U9IIH5_9CREN|nr:hypothetical protein [Acidianus brierleyi]AWR95820.1 hypothetical protein DFR85_15770 [Acidianus brierleyi]